jgi:8-oxo-dGTP diphosphatase
MIRRYGEPVKPGQSYKRRPGVYAVLALDDRVLITHQAAPVPEYQLPGGGIDGGEHPIAALHREVREETGWKIAIGHRLGAYRRFTFMPDYGFWAEKICTVYLARPVYRLGPPTELGHTAVWMTIPQAMNRLNSNGDAAMLAAYFKTLR